MGKLSEELADRLVRVAPWRLRFYLLMPIGFGAFWFVRTVRTGLVGWAVWFGVLLALAVAIWLTAVILKVRAARRCRSNRDTTRHPEAAVPYDCRMHEGGHARPASLIGAEGEPAAEGPRRGEEPYNAAADLLERNL